jgi:uncharacterized protein YegP (UPF0339 family)/sugar lactone lactonase YvrE
MSTFAQTSTFQSDQKFEPRPTHAVPQLDVSDDGRALTLTFSAFELTIGGTKSPAPTSTHAFSFVLPLVGEDNESVEIDFHVQGFVLTTEGATATVVLSVNGQTTFADFAANSEESYLQSLKFTASSPPSECRLSVFLLVGRDSTNSDAEAFINTLSIDANIPSAPAGSMLERPPSFVTKWGQMGERDGRFVTPQGVAVDSSGNVYVADMGMDRIQKFDSEGTFSTKWGSAGDENGEFHEPQGVAVDSSGNVYVADTVNHRIQKFDFEGTFSTKWGSQGDRDGEFNGPRGVDVDSSGNVYVTDELNHRIQKFDSEGTFIGEWGSEGTEDGEFKDPMGVAVDSSDNVYIGDGGNNRIQKFDSEGTFMAKWGSQGEGNGEFGNGVFSSPTGVAVDSSNNVYVSEQGSNRIQKFGKGVTRVAEFEIYKDQDNPQDFRWRLRANNGEIIADSGEGYNDRDDCEHGIDLVKSQAPTAQVQDLT